MRFSSATAVLSSIFFRTTTSFPTHSSTTTTAAATSSRLRSSSVSGTTHQKTPSPSVTMSSRSSSITSIAASSTAETPVNPPPDDDDHDDQDQEDQGNVNKKAKISPWGGSPVEDDAATPYTPPKVWTWEHPDLESVNRPTAGSRYNQTLPVGKHPLQLYSLGTPNGQKVTIMLEELLEAGYTGAEYDAWLIRIMNKEQFSSGFTSINPNSKIPALVDKSSSEKKDFNVFESGSILLYLAEKFDNAFLPTDPYQRVQAINWLFWNVGSAPFVGGGFGHFYHYAPTKLKYPIDRYTMETKRLLDVLNNQLEHNDYLTGNDYTIADIANYAWYSGLLTDAFYAGSAEFLNVKEEYPHVIRWANTIGSRPAVKRGKMVNKTWGEPSSQLHERHDASDFELRTADKLQQQEQEEKK